MKTAKTTLILTTLLALSLLPLAAANWQIAPSWQTNINPQWIINGYPAPTPTPPSGQSGGNPIVTTPPTTDDTIDPDASTNPQTTNQPEPTPNIIDQLNPENLPGAFYFIVAVFFILAIGLVVASQTKTKHKSKVTWKPY